MNKKIIASSIVSLALIGMTAAPAFAFTASSTNPTGGKTDKADRAATAAADVAAKIACVGTAVNAREASMDTGVTTYTAALNAAYSARAAALTAAFTQTTLKGLQTARSSAWSAFTISTRTARKSWLSTRDSAWAKYRTAVVVCKAPAGITDGTNSSFEATGN